MSRMTEEDLGWFNLKASSLRTKFHSTRGPIQASEGEKEPTVPPSYDACEAQPDQHGMIN